MTRTVPPVNSLTSTTRVTRTHTLPSPLKRPAKTNVFVRLKGTDKTIDSGSRQSLHRVERTRQMKAKYSRRTTTADFEALPLPCARFDSLQAQLSGSLVRVILLTVRTVLFEEQLLFRSVAILTEAKRPNWLTLRGVQAPASETKLLTGVTFDGAWIQTPRTAPSLLCTVGLVRITI